LVPIIGSRIKGDEKLINKPNYSKGLWCFGISGTITINHIKDQSTSFVGWCFFSFVCCKRHHRFRPSDSECPDARVPSLEWSPPYSRIRLGS